MSNVSTIRVILFRVITILICAVSALCLMGQEVNCSDNSRLRLDSPVSCMEQYHEVFTYNLHTIFIEGKRNNENEDVTPIT